MNDRDSFATPGRMTFFSQTLNNAGNPGFAHFVGPIFICLVSQLYKQRIEELFKVVDVAGLKVIAPIAWNSFSEVVGGVLLPRLPASGHVLKRVPAYNLSNDRFAKSIGEEP